MSICCAENTFDINNSEMNEDWLNSSIPFSLHFRYFITSKVTSTPWRVVGVWPLYVCFLIVAINSCSLRKKKLLLIFCLTYKNRNITVECYLTCIWRYLSNVTMSLWSKINYYFCERTLPNVETCLRWKNA